MSIFLTKAEHVFFSKLIQQRKNLIAYGVSKNNLSTFCCDVLKQKLEVAQSSTTLASFIVQNIDDLRKLPPARAKCILTKINDLFTLSQSIINE